MIVLSSDLLLSPFSRRDCGWVGGSGDAAGVVNASLAQTLAAGERGERRVMGCISLYAAPCSGAGGARLTAWRPRRGGVDGTSILAGLARLVSLAVLVPQWAVGARRGPGGEHWSSCWLAQFCFPTLSSEPAES